MTERTEAWSGFSAAAYPETESPFPRMSGAETGPGLFAGDSRSLDII